jgi:hypothetical protein
MEIRIGKPLIRKADWTISPLLIDGVQIGYVCEDEIRTEKVHGETAIWAGTYECKFRHSPSMSKQYLYDPKSYELVSPKYAEAYKHFKPNHPMIEITGIKGFQYVMFHWGNTDKESLGCPLVGRSIGVVNGRDAVIQSRDFYTRTFYPRVARALASGEKVVCVVER